MDARRAGTAAGLIFLAACHGSAPPNVLFFVVDTLRADAVGAYGHPHVETPAMDRLAREGALFENAWASSSWTRESMASLLTSTDASVHGSRDRDDALAEGSVLLSEILAAHGYRSALFTANPNVGSFFGFDQGFDDFFELYERRKSGIVRTRELVTRADKLVHVAAQWIDRAPEPFFALLLAIDPHALYDPPEAFDRYGVAGAYPEPMTHHWMNREDLSDAEKERIRSLYLGEVSFADHAFGVLLDRLRERGRADRTIVVLTSDHGEEFWEHGQRGHGRTLYDEVLRIPLIVRYPPQVAPGLRLDRPASSIDLMPTVLALAGLPIPHGLEGTDLLAEPPASDVRVFSSLGMAGARLSSVREGPWKLIRDGEGDRELLFRTDVDAAESRDVRGEHPARAALLARELEKHGSRGRARSQALHGPEGPRQVSPSELPDAQRRLLEELGYVEQGDGDDR